MTRGESGAGRMLGVRACQPRPSSSPPRSGRKPKNCCGGRRRMKKTWPAGTPAQNPPAAGFHGSRTRLGSRLAFERSCEGAGPAPREYGHLTCGGSALVPGTSGKPPCDRHRTASPRSLYPAILGITRAPQPWTRRTLQRQPGDWPGPSQDGPPGLGQTEDGQGQSGKNWQGVGPQQAL